MSAIPCAHKTLNDHSKVVGGARIWRCSVCGKEERWSDAWSYFGTLECRLCWVADIEFVCCSEACRVAKGGKKASKAEDDLEKQAKPVRCERVKRRPAWERKALAAGWSPPAEDEAAQAAERTKRA